MEWNLFFTVLEALSAWVGWGLIALVLYVKIDLAEYRIKSWEVPDAAKVFGVCGPLSLIAVAVAFYIKRSR